MIAQVVPATRLRRDTTWWSYRIPPRTPCVPGSLVIIPFRGRLCLGVVWQVEKEHPEATLEISQVLTTTPLVKAFHRQLIEFLSDYGLCSLSTALHLWLPRGLRQLPLSPEVIRLLQTYTAAAPGAPQHAILVPGYRPLFATELQKKFQTRFQTLFEDTPDIELKKWFAIANGEIQLGLGRIRSLFAPWNNLHQLTILDPEDISYNQEQTPYLNLVEAALAYASFNQARVHLRTALPESACRLLWPNHASSGKTTYPALTFQDLRRESLLNPLLIQTIQQTLRQGKRVLILYNAYDRTVERQTDGQTEQILIPGIQTLKKRLARLLELNQLPDSILIGSRSLLQEKQTNIGHTIILSLDPLLGQSGQFANFLHGIADIGKLVDYKVPCLFQSCQPDHPLVNALSQGRIDAYLTHYITEQQEQGLPPFGQNIALSVQEGKLSEAEITTVYEQLLPLTGPLWSISHPFKGLWRKKSYSTIMLHTPSSTERLPILLRKKVVSLPRPWKVQRNPWHLL